ncbi:MAG: sugar phosphate isomerase/epimerase [Clostridia bacterium]|nr:sugar phosphate isomerase/epimerase [Clostridia bacterium]
MKFGICFSAQEALESEMFGADYLELNALSVNNLTDEEFACLKGRIERGEIRTYSCNGLVDPDCRLTGEGVDFDAIRAYSERVFNRLAQLGVTMLVFGSSKAKHVPEGFPFEKAWEQLKQVGEIFSDCAAKHGQTIAIEPLSYNEVNIINTLGDAAEYSRLVNKENYKILADFYHVDNNKEDFATFETYKDLLVHTHIATSGDRCMPQDEKDWEFFAKCIGTLKKIGYQGNISFEGKRNEGNAGVSEMIARMRQIYAEV